MRPALAAFRERSGLGECVIVQTCNRVELFGAAPEGLDLGGVRRAWASMTGLDEAAFAKNAEYGRGREVVEHLLRMAAGLDSMVIGEEQILGQVKGAIAAAREEGASGDRLNALFDRTVRAGARIRNSTGIGRGGVSVGSMAVRLAEENVDGMKSKRTLLIGTGEVSTLVAKSLSRRGYPFSVASRTLGRSRAFCGALGGSPVRFEEVVPGFKDYDVLFVATAAPYFLVTYGRIAEAMEAKGQGGGMMVMDLSNPRTVDERVATLGGVKLMNLDQIAEMVDKNVRSRVSKAAEVEAVIGEEIPVIEAALNRLDAEPLVKGVFASADAMRERETRRALRMLREEDPARVRIIEDLTRSVMEGIVAGPMNNVRKASELGDSATTEAAAKIFGPADRADARDGGRAAEAPAEARP